MTPEDKVARLDGLVLRCEQLAIVALERALERALGPEHDADAEDGERQVERAARLMAVANSFAVAYERASIALDEAVAEG